MPYPTIRTVLTGFGMAAVMCPSFAQAQAEARQGRLGSALACWLLYGWLLCHETSFGFMILQDHVCWFLWASQISGVFFSEHRIPPPIPPHPFLQDLHHSSLIHPTVSGHQVPGIPASSFIMRAVFGVFCCLFMFVSCSLCILSVHILASGYDCVPFGDVCTVWMSENGSHNP